MSMYHMPSLALVLRLVFGNHTSPAYNETDAVLHYHYALVAFCNETAIQAWSCGPLCNAMSAPERSIFISPGTDYGVQGYVAVWPDSDGHRSCAVGFRGTQPGNMLNVFADLSGWDVSWPPPNAGLNSSWCTHCRVDAGFAGAHDDISDQVRDALSELRCTTATFNGHSLGAAVAGLSSMMTRVENAVKVPAVWTYGMPRVGNAAFVRAYVDLAELQGASPPLWRIVHFNDLIPRLNLRINYWAPRHVPLEVFYPTESFPGPVSICPPESGDPSNENKTCMNEAPFYKWNPDDHMHYLGVDFYQMAGDEHCGFHGMPFDYRGAVFALVLAFALLTFLCVCACPCCCGGCCAYRYCKRKVRPMWLGSSRPLIDADEEETSLAVVETPDEPAQCRREQSVQQLAAEEDAWTPTQGGA